MRTRIQRRGSSLALRIPKTFAIDAHLTAGTVVEVSLQNGQIVVRPVKTSAWTLERLLAGVTKRNLHHEIETGSAMGREVQ